MEDKVMKLLAATSLIFILAGRLYYDEYRIGKLESLKFTADQEHGVILPDNLIAGGMIVTIHGKEYMPLLVPRR